MNLKSIAIAGSILLMSACASVSAKSVDYPSYAGAAIREVRFQSGLYNWQRLSDVSLVVWTRPGEAYLLTLRNDCNALRTAKAVLISDMDGINGRMIAGSTDVIAGIMRCRIDSIQPIDQQRLKADQK